MLTMCALQMFVLNYYYYTAGISRYSITTGRQRVSLQETAGDRSEWRELVAALTAETHFVMTTDLT